MEEDIDISDLVGKTVASIDVVDDPKKDNQIIFKCIDGSEYIMHHVKDCCESVYIEDICGDINDLIGVPIVRAEEVSNEPEPVSELSEDYESYTWTFYKFAAKADVTIRWFGSSNGYYSESVYFVQTKEPRFKLLLK